MKKPTYKKTHIGEHKLHAETQMMSYGYDPQMSEGAVKPPVFLTSTFVFKTAEDGADYFDIVSGRKPQPEGKSAGLIYSRLNHPNLEILEDRLALLEGGDSADVFASGMAAISAVFQAFVRPGDVIVHSSPLYGGTETLIRKVLAEWNVASTEFHDGLSEEAISRALEEGAGKGRVAVIYVETPANPTNALIDFVAVNNAADAFAKKHGSRPIIVCDNTMLGPIFQKPLAQGVDISVYSLTKYVGGHSDLIAGAVIGDNERMAQVRMMRHAYGSQLDPHSSWMLGRSLETLGLRMRRAAESGRAVAKWLHNNPYSPVQVLHPEYIANEDYQEVYHRQCEGPGSTFSFVVQGGREKAFKVINNLSLFKSAVSLGGTESLVSHPASMTHSGVPVEVREDVGVTEGLIRVSIGLEHPDDLNADLDMAFSKTFR
ncbi:MAG TPA: cystathionine gamma-synthase family protein [Thermoflexales bacterium]|nr:cystathionine gamma-synthase family protein [Thermoflexales bacterium]HQZ21761.1 cystathionine gamma-synthase family protein [Thermoflexales bacterium]HQZ98942.1 cystathionine gamma-synthase family protein [Thermoflexales bacterium]